MTAPRPYQLQAADAVDLAFESHQSTVVEMATGAGKTVVIREDLRRRRHLGRALVLAHRRELITQAKAQLERIGLTVDVEMAGEHARRSVTLLGVSDVVVASVASLRGRRLARWDRESFATVVIDECHHAAAATYRRIIDYFSGAKVLGVTATGDRGDGIGLGNVFESVAFRYSIREAIADGWLCPVRAQRVHCADLDLSTVRSVRGDLSEADLEAAITVDKVLHEIARPLTELAAERQTILFMPGVESAQAITEVLGAYLGVGRAGFVHGGQTRSVREDVIRKYLSGEIQILANCAVLTEGFDAPSTACVAIARPTKSRSLYSQMVGRGTRLAPEKTDLLIIDFVGNAGRHRLIGPTDVLAGKPIPDSVKTEIESEANKGPVSMDDIDDMIDKAEERERARLERLAAAQRRSNVRGWVPFTTENVDPWQATLEVDCSLPGPRASDAQLAVLRGVGIQGTPNRREASRLIGMLVERRRAGLCSYRQARLLLKHGFRQDLSFEEAKDVLDKLAANCWRPTPGLLEQYGRDRSVA